MTAVTLLSGLAVQQPLERIVFPLFREQHGADVDATFEPTSILVDLLRGGTCADVIVGVREALIGLVRESIVEGDSVETLVKVGLGIAVAKGAPIPQVNGLREFITLLVSARSVAYSQAGASGIYFSALLDRLGIGDRVKSTATVIPSGYTGRCLLDGRADIAVQQLSELRSVSGIAVVGPFPPEVQHYTIFAAGNVVQSNPHSDNEDLVRGLRALFSGAPARAAYVEAGLELVDAG